MSETTNKAAKAAETEQQGSDLIVVLRSPVEFEGKTYDKVDLTRLKDLSLDDMEAAERAARETQIGSVNLEFTLPYAMTLAARAADLPIEFFNSVKPRDLIAIKTRVVGFLYSQA